MLCRVRFIGLIAIATLALSASALWSQDKKITWKTATGVEDHERLFWQELKAKNWNIIESHMASQYTHSGPTGVYNKQQTLDSFRTFTLLDYSLNDFNVTSHGDTAIATYTATFSFVESGKTIGPMTTRVMSVWQQQKKSWAVIASAETELPKPQ